jgi:hypothetical protein
MRYRRLLAALFALVLAAWQPAVADDAGPFSVGASVGPAAASRVDALVTRRVGGKAVTLPAAAVPALEPGDEVVVRFPDYTRPPAKVNYHVDVAFITETPPVGWLYGKSGPWDQLFSNRRGRRTPPPRIPEIRFVYGVGDRRGIPIFFIVPEDGKTRGLDGVRDYVEAHPTDFKDMSTSANDAVERYGWFRDFLSSLAQGAVDTNLQQQRVVSIATSLGASPSSVESCYAQQPPASSAEIAACVRGALLAVQYQTNIDAPTQAQFFGGVVSAATPLQYALYLEPLLAIWKIFSSIGHKEYEYLPTTLHLVAPPSPGAPSTQLLMGLKVPTLRPPAAYSSALFFTIGDPDAVANPPSVVDEDKGTGVCARDPRIRIPVHLDRTSQYVNDTALVFTSENGSSSVRVPIRPQNAAAPLADRSKLEPGHGYDVKLTGRFGFDSIAGSQQTIAHVAVPGDAHWQIGTVAYHPARAGGALDAIATSEDAPCLSGAELQMGGNPPIPLSITHLDDRRIELTASLGSVPPGIAQIHFFQDDPANHRRIADAATLAIEPQAAGVASGAMPIAYIGDRAVLLSGSGFDGVAGLRIGSAYYAKTPASHADSACFLGPPIGGPASRAGSVVSAELVPSAGGAGQVFAMRLEGRRPGLADVQTVPSAAVHLSNDALTITLTSAQPRLPRRFGVRMRQAPSTTTPCDGLHEDDTAALVPAADVVRESASTAKLVLRAGDVLHDDAFGTLQVQIVDLENKHASDWYDLAGDFALAPAPAPSPSPAM